jgi:hypothetical protein
MATHVFEEAADLIRWRLAEDEERRRLERALAELGGKVTGRPRRGPGRPRGSGGKAATRAAGAKANAPIRPRS